MESGGDIDLFADIHKTKRFLSLNEGMDKQQVL
jgi:hypothetical protein